MQLFTLTSIIQHVIRFSLYITKYRNAGSDAGACLVAGGNLVDCSVPATAQNCDSALISSVSDDSRQQSKTKKVVISINLTVVECHVVFFS